MCWGTPCTTEKTKQEFSSEKPLVQQKKRNNFPYAVKKIKINLQGCMKSCKGIKTNLGKVLGNRLCNRKNETIYLMLCRKLKKISSRLYEKL